MKKNSSAADGARLLASTVDAWAVPGLTAASTDAWSVTVQYRDESTAIEVATALGLTAPRKRRVSSDGFDGFGSTGSIDGLEVRVVSCWMIDDEAVAA